MAAVATRPSPNIAQNVERQPQTLPIAVPAGTPMMPETVRPARISATAMPRCSGRTSPTATTMATPK